MSHFKYTINLKILNLMYCCDSFRSCSLYLLPICISRKNFGYDWKINRLSWHLLVAICVCVSWKQPSDKSYLKMQMYWSVLSSPSHSNQAVTMGPCLIYRIFVTSAKLHGVTASHVSVSRESHNCCHYNNTLFRTMKKVKVTDHNYFLICVGHLKLK